MDTLINIGIFITYLMVACGALMAIGFGIKKMAENPENAKKTLYTIGGLIAVLVISYIIASDEVLKSFEKYGISESTSKLVGMGLFSFYLLILGAIIAVLLDLFSVYDYLTKLLSK